MESKKRTRRKTKKQSFFMTLVFTAAAALAIYFAVSFFSAYKDINEKKEELAGLQTQYEEQVQQNKDIEKTIKENDEEAKNIIQSHRDTSRILNEAISIVYEESRTNRAKFLKEQCNDDEFKREMCKLVAQYNSDGQSDGFWSYVAEWLNSQAET